MKIPAWCCECVGRFLCVVKTDYKGVRCLNFHKNNNIIINKLLRVCTDTAKCLNSITTEEFKLGKDQKCRDELKEVIKITKEYLNIK